MSIGQLWVEPAKIAGFFNENKNRVPLGAVLAKGMR
jgi:hypothetical protein